jgi:hypothetical protein
MRRVSFDKQVSTPPQVVTRPLDGELVLLNLDTETYYGLDEVGTRMWELLSSSPTIESAFEQLVSEYEVDAATLRVDLEALLGQLVDGGLVELNEV